MTRRELDAAGITDPALREAYTTCRRLNARHGRSFFLATRLLPAPDRPAVHALYGYARYADDIVDDLHTDATPRMRSAALADLQDELDAALCGESGDKAVVRALADTIARYDISHQLFIDFLTAMRCDLEVTDHPDYASLCAYMDGSAVAIGLQVLTVMGTVVPLEETVPFATCAGYALQLTNFLRDVGEDLDRGRVYLPADLLAAHNVNRELLEWSRLTATQDKRITAALTAAADLTRSLYREAAPVISMVHPLARPMMKGCLTLYAGILDVIADNGYVVMDRRAVVPRRRRAAFALSGIAEAGAARLRHRAKPQKTSGTSKPHAPAPSSPADQIVSGRQR